MVIGMFSGLLVGCRSLKPIIPVISALLFAVSAATIGGPSFAASLQEEASYLLDSHPRIMAARNNVLATDEGINRAFAEYLPTIDAVAN